MSQVASKTRRAYDKDAARVRQRRDVRATRGATKTRRIRDARCDTRCALRRVRDARSPCSVAPQDSLTLVGISKMKSKNLKKNYAAWRLRTCDAMCATRTQRALRQARRVRDTRATCDKDATRVRQRRDATARDADAYAANTPPPSALCIQRAHPAAMWRRGGWCVSRARVARMSRVRHTRVAGV